MRWKNAGQGKMIILDDVLHYSLYYKCPRSLPTKNGSETMITSLRYSLLVVSVFKFAVLQFNLELFTLLAPLYL